MSQSAPSYSRLEAGLAALTPLHAAVAAPSTMAPPQANHVAADSPKRIEVWANEGGSTEKAPTRALRVLVVEDDALIGILLAETLEEMGYEICAIEATEAGAVDAARRCRPDLMVVDAWLGDGTGISAVEKILRTGFIPHLFVSGDISKIRPMRPDAVMLQKPFNEIDLALAIARALGAEFAA